MVCQKSFLQNKYILKYDQSSKKLIKHFDSMRLTNFYCASYDNTIKLFDIESKECIQTYEGHIDLVRCLILAPGNRLISGGNDGLIKIWNNESGECIKTIYEHTELVSCILLVSNDKFLSCSRDNTVKLFDLNTFHCIKTFRIKIHHFSTLPVDLLSTDKIICSGEEIKIFDLNTGECLKTIHHKALFSVKVISNELIMIGTKEGELKVLNIVTGLCTHKFKGFFDCIIKLTDEHIAYVCSRDSTKIKIWNINSGERKTILTSHTGQISMLAKSSDNKIISCSNDKTIKEWDIETGQCLNILNFNSIYIYTK